MADLQNYLQQSFDTTASVRDASGDKGISEWNDAWSNFMIQHALSEYEYSNNKEMWNLMNEYNSPAAQMERFRAAGLNPNLIYTQGTNGNAGSSVQYKAPNLSFTPKKNEQDLMTQRLQGAVQIIGAINNLAQNIAGLYDAGLNVQLKRNELAWSNTEVARAKHHIINFGDPNQTPYYRSVSAIDPSGNPVPHFPSVLNPFSDNFSPLEYMTLMRLGKVPQFFNQYMTSEAGSQLNHLKGQYQQYYNEELLPLFRDYQEGKVQMQSLQNWFLDYNKTAMDMLPPEMRGLMQFVLPILKMAFGIH